jgi:hypothetical protein
MDEFFKHQVYLGTCSHFSLICQQFKTDLDRIYNENKIVFVQREKERMKLSKLPYVKEKQYYYYRSEFVIKLKQKRKHC